MSGSQKMLPSSLGAFIRRRVFKFTIESERDLFFAFRESLIQIPSHVSMDLDLFPVSHSGHSGRRDNVAHLDVSDVDRAAELFKS